MNRSASRTDNAAVPVHEFVYLASASQRRAQLLDQVGVAYRLLAPDIDEDAEALEEVLGAELPLAYVRRVTLLKLAAARARLKRRSLPDAPIVCADTTVALGRRILGKPRDAGHAAEMLRSLSGCTHRVITAVAVGAGRRDLLATSVSRVRFAPLSETTIRRYVESGEPEGKAGAYAVQGRIAAWIEHLEGSYTGIMGLPLHQTITLLARASVRLAL
jgi:nucleoside triphosphate pyrophosphatase